MRPSPAGWGERSEPHRSLPVVERWGSLRSPHPTVAGFTLLELMVVLVIVGVILTFVTLSMGGDGRAEQLEREARRLAALLELAGEEAVLRSDQLAVRFGDSDYEFLILAGGQWLPLSGDPQFRLRRLPAGMRMRLELEDSPPPDLDASDENLPQVFLLSSGEMTPFTVTLSADETEQRFLVRASLLGRLEIE